MTTQERADILSSITTMAASLAGESIDGYVVPGSRARLAYVADVAAGVGITRTDIGQAVAAGLADPWVLERVA